MFCLILEGSNMATMQTLQWTWQEHLLSFSTRYWQIAGHRNINNHYAFLTKVSRSQWSRSIRRGSAGARLLGFWVRILSGTCISVFCECCVFSGTCWCDGLMACPEESYRLWCVWVWSWSLDREEAWAH